MRSEMLKATASGRIHCQREHIAVLYQLAIANAHLPGSELANAMKLAGFDSSSPALQQGQTLIANCASAAMKIATLLERLSKSENDKGDKNG